MKQLFIALFHRFFLEEAKLRAEQEQLEREERERQEREEKERLREEVGKMIMYMYYLRLDNLVAW